MGELEHLRMIVAEARALAEQWQRSEDRGWVASQGDELMDVITQQSARLAALSNVQPAPRLPDPSRPS